ncbi:thiamine ABC transporter substrate-binding protein [Candidatus Acetothermia bacterium]|nr:thiamine ABC transporter substrate-binding protein [Candidatus Acetothermia bacterium]MBI3644236.1 thiamine ABC transporter substrate-binding protein [Candidatus Acetothermia bacterium]
MLKASKYLVLIALAAGFIWMGSAVSLSQQGSTLTVYTYSSFVSYGMADVVAQAFKSATGADIRFVATSDSRAMLSRLITERDARGEAPADVFVGVEVNDLKTARAHDVFESLSTDDVPNLANIPQEIQFDSESKLIPYEHGFITLIYNSTTLKPEDAPKTFQELLDPKYKKSIIMIDPRTSSVGLSFLLWTISKFGESGYLDYWKQLKPNLLTITDSWDSAFDLFSKGEAPIMVSFSTDHAYDLIVNGSDQIQVLALEGQGYRTIFGAGIVKGTKQEALAKQLLNILLSPQVQSQIAETEWMIPANPNAQARLLWFQNVVFPGSPESLAAEDVSQNVDHWIDQWVNTVLSN